MAGAKYGVGGSAVVHWPTADGGGSNRAVTTLERALGAASRPFFSRTVPLSTVDRFPLSR